MDAVLRSAIVTLTIISSTLQGIVVTLYVLLCISSISMSFVVNVHWHEDCDVMAV